MADLRVGQVWEDTYLTQPNTPPGKGARWLVKVMKINEKSARVEPCSDDGWYIVAGYRFQYRMENRHFERGRMQLVEDVPRYADA